MREVSSGCASVRRKRMRISWLTLTHAGVCLEMQQELISRFSSMAFGGHESFTQSNTFVSFHRKEDLVDDKVFGLTPSWLRHSYRLVWSFVIVCIEVISSAFQDPTLLDAFNWSIVLISKQLTLTTIERFAVVTQAINNNQQKNWRTRSRPLSVVSGPISILVVQVGTNNISPLLARQ